MAGAVVGTYIDERMTESSLDEARASGFGLTSGFGLIRTARPVTVPAYIAATGAVAALPDQPIRGRWSLDVGAPDGAVRDSPP
jgi:hypothetical protein